MTNSYIPSDVHSASTKASSHPYHINRSVLYGLYGCMLDQPCIPGINNLVMWLKWNCFLEDDNDHLL
jgi:hypothetical protein